MGTIVRAAFPRRGTDCCEQRAIIERLQEVVRSTGGEDTFPDAGLVLAGNDDDWQPGPGIGEMLLHVASRQSGHVKVKHQTIRTMQRQGVQEFAARGERLHVHVRGTEKPPQRFAHGFLVVHDGNL